MIIRPHLSAGVCLQEAAKALCICSILKHNHAIKELIHLDDRAAIRPLPLEQLQSRRQVGHSGHCKHTSAHDGSSSWGPGATAS